MGAFFAFHSSSSSSGRLIAQTGRAESLIENASTTAAAASYSVSEHSTEQ
jgi:hypothetical protein